MKKTASENKPKQRRINFRIQADPGSRVSVAGDFNNWNPDSKLLKDTKGVGHYTGSLMVEPGTYQYKFVVNGTWLPDPACEEQVENTCGTRNSVLRVK